MNALSVFVIQCTLTLVGFGWLARIYFYPRLARLPLYEALTVLCFFHVFRGIGLTYMVPGVANEPIPKDFAMQAGYGDLLTALLAIVAIYLLRIGSPRAIAAVWIMNVVGMLDFLNDYFLGMSIHAWNYASGALWFNPSILAPICIVAHAMAFTMLIRRRERKSKH